MRKVVGSGSAGRARAALAGGVVLWLAAVPLPAGAQQPPVKDQCTVDREQIGVCRQAVEQCAVDMRTLFAQRERSRDELASLRTRTCGPDTEPRWREIVKALIDRRLGPLRLEPQPGSRDCERLAYSVSGNGRLLVEGRAKDVAAKKRQVREEVRLALNGVDIEIDDSGLTSAEPCPGAQPDNPWERDGDAPQSRDTLAAAKVARMPPVTECAAIGAGFDRDRALDAALRRKIEEGFWVLDGGLTALCRKNPTSSAWEITKTNIHPHTEGVTILRRTP